MNDIWHSFLNKMGAVFDGNTVTHFGNPDRERLAALESNIVANLSGLGAIKASGDDATTFLHNQFTNDLKALAPGQSQLSGYCSPKGRLLALFRVIALEEGYLLILPREVLPQTLKRLRMFVLMSKVELVDVSDEIVQIGLSGPDAETLLQPHFNEVPSAVDQAVSREELTAVRIPGPMPRFHIFGTANAMEPLWRSLSESVAAAGPGNWELLDIKAGLPVIHKENVEAFVPQMVNLQAVGGLSFTKGCYPGQEVVARMQYLGKLKRRMYIAHAEGDTPPAPGTPIVSMEDGKTRKVGQVVAAQLTAPTEIALTAVIEIAAAEGKALHIESTSGSTLALETLPYPLDQGNQG